MIKEQRLTTRFTSQSRLYFSIPGNDTQFEGESINISNNGLLLSSSCEVNPGHVISVCLYNENSTGQTLNILAKVIWCNQQNPGQFHVGALIKVIMAANELNNV